MATLVELAVRTARSLCCVASFTVEGWDAPDELDDGALRGAVQHFAPAAHGALSDFSTVPPSRLVGRPVAWQVTRPTPGGPAAVRLVYEHPDPDAFCLQFRPGSATPPPSWAAQPAGQGMRMVETAASHLGEIPLLPPLAVLCGYRPFYARSLFPQLAPLRAVTDGWAQSVDSSWQQDAPPDSALPPPLWHYSRFAWQPTPEGSGWCGTYLFYGSPAPVGPLNLYPLHEDATLAPVPPRAEGARAPFDPSYVRMDWRQSPRVGPGEECVLRLGDLVREISTQVLLRPEYQDFATFVAAHGLRHPSPELFLEVGMEKALISVLYFFPLVPVAGFTYDHTFSAVPEPQTLCLTAPHANRLLAPVHRTRDAAAMMAVARACESGTAEADFPAAALGAVPLLALSKLFALRHWGLDEDSDLGAYARSHFSQAGLRYLASRAPEEGDGAEAAKEHSAALAFLSTASAERVPPAAAEP
eukprot:TRINITY_DN60566_c0_g1_i1.p1 TRINITY_DN60566_c0_g1~~TRINITY_DN60566_c0_g1_i1.p1  ORF type:complete len:472 (+),score=148.03 TRINITY_DN60566_c0_g1_i1:81-1496(+)